MTTIRMPSGIYTDLTQLRKTSHKVLYLARSQCTGQQVVLCKLLEQTDVYHLLQLVTHPNLVCVLDVETQSNGITYVILEYINAPLLSDEMKRRQFTQREVIRIGIQLCAALHALHSVGLIHRDVKPENIFLLPDGSIKLFDYDASRIFKASIGSDTTPMGTFGYAAPEQFGLKQSDARSDIYALGILLNMLSVGEHPSVRLCKGILRRIVLRCTHVSPEKRYRNSVQVQHALQNCLLLRWASPAAALTALGVFLLLVLLRPASAPMQTPALPTADASASPAPSPAIIESVTPLPTEPPYMYEDVLPPAFDIGTYSVQEFLLENHTYYLLLTTDAFEQYTPNPSQRRRRVYLTPNTEQDLHLIIWPSDGDSSTISTFRSHIQRLSCTMAPQNRDDPLITLSEFALSSHDTSTMLASSKLTSSAFPSAAGIQPVHHMASITIEMDDGRIISMQLSTSLIPEQIVLSSSPAFPMETTSQLNILLDALDDLYGSDAPITLQLPAQVYDEQVVLARPAVTLQGKPGNTVFQGGLSVGCHGLSDEIRLENIVFQGSGNGTAIESSCNLALEQCAFDQYDTCYTVPNHATVTGNSITGSTHFAPHEPGEPDLTTAVGLNAYLANLPDEILRQRNPIIQLPAANYFETVYVPYPVSLIGADGKKTKLTAGLRYTAEDGYVTVRNCDFYDTGYDVAVTSSHDILLLECDFHDFVYAAMPTSDRNIDIDFLDCNFERIDYLHPGEERLVYH